VSGRYRHRIIALLLASCMAVDSSASTIVASLNTPSSQTDHPLPLSFETEALATVAEWCRKPLALGRASYLRIAAALYLPLPRPSIETLTEKPIPEGIDQPVLALFDVHGTLLKPTWLEEFVFTYAFHKRTSHRAAKAWVDRHIRFEHSAKRANIRALRDACGVSEEVILKTLQRARDELPAEAMPGAIDFVRALKSRGVPVIVFSNSSRDVTLNALKHAGFSNVLASENIIGGDQMLRSQKKGARRDSFLNEKVLQSLQTHYPNHRVVLFDDWTDRVSAVHAIHGQVFGIPQSESGPDERNSNRVVLHQAGVDFIQDGWRDWPHILRQLQIESQRQRQDKRREIAHGIAQELTLVLPAARPHWIPFHIEVSEDFRTLTYSFVWNDRPVFKWEGPVNYDAIRMKLLKRFPSSYLLSPLNFIEATFNPLLRRAILLIWNMNRRYTTYQGLTTSWDKSVDWDVWSTNIDTVFLDDRLQTSGLLAGMQQRNLLRKIVELGTGGGHLSSRLASMNPEELTITDISFYALRCALRNILVYLTPQTRLRTYLGKGLLTLEGDQDAIVINPPYIPYPPSENLADEDPYRGTGLIREALESGIDKLNPLNPEASLFINISSLAQKDWDQYLAQFGDRLLVEPVGESLKVPLKIRAIKKDWREWLVGQGGLEDRGPSVSKGEERYWHTLQTYRVRPRYTLYTNYAGRERDPADPATIPELSTRVSLAGPLQFDASGRPLNPMEGASELDEGKGILYFYGASLAGDGIVTRENPQNGELEQLQILRKDGQWAGPGGFLDLRFDKDIFDTISREIEEETSVPLDFRRDTIEIHRGPVKDPRNRRHAWIESVALWKHLSPEMAARVHPEGKDDASRGFRWAPLEKIDLNQLYGSHGDLAAKVLEYWKDGKRPKPVQPPQLQTEIDAIQSQIEEMPLDQFLWLNHPPKDGPGERIGYFPLTADPVQPMHIRIAKDYLARGLFTQIVITVSKDHVTKRTADAEELATRAVMLNRAFGDDPRISVAISDSGRFLRLLELTQRSTPLAERTLLTGIENLKVMLENNTPERLQAILESGADIFFHGRHDLGSEQIPRLLADHADKVPPGFAARLHFKEVAPENISSSLLRVLISDGEELWKELVGRGIAEIIESRGLYQQIIDPETRAAVYQAHKHRIDEWIRQGVLRHPHLWTLQAAA
jgi:beta-phosphoglucomutase-like phosphatase (HAD superfamily)/nicotinic acid mononucleotide adenylyltransferase/ADP-ribose pyrophosphatase YjhB (NUDIX family)